MTKSRLIAMLREVEDDSPIKFFIGDDCQSLREFSIRCIGEDEELSSDGSTLILLESVDHA